MATGTGLAAFFPLGFDPGWMRINREAIYGTRPRKVFGEGAHAAKNGAFAGRSTGELDARDFRFTRNQRGDVVYAIVLGWPEGNIVIKSPGAASTARPARWKTSKRSAANKSWPGAGEPNRSHSKGLRQSPEPVSFCSRSGRMRTIFICLAGQNRLKIFTCNML